MSQSGGSHVQLRLGLYVLGALPAAEEVEVAEHVDRCSTCRSEFAELGEVAAVLALLSEEDVRDLTDEFDPARPQLPIPSSRKKEPEPAIRLTSKPAATGRASPRTKLVLSAVMVALVVGVGIGIWSQRPGRQSPIGPDVAVTAPQSGAAATLSVVLTPRSDALGVRAVVVGMLPGLRFQLTAVTADGQSHVVYQGLAVGGPQTVVGDLHVAATEITLFTVAKADGPVVVSVRFVNGFPAP